MNYIECDHCKNMLENYPIEYWIEHPCPFCKNTRKVIDPREVLCNLCTGPMCPLGTMNEQIPHGLYRAKVIGGYDSYHLSDCYKYTFNICEKCLRELFIKCKIKPDIRDVGITGDADIICDWEKDQEGYEYRVWKDTGGFHQAYMDGKCNSIKDCPNKAVYTILLNDEFTEDSTCEDHKGMRLYANSKLTTFIPNKIRVFL